MGMLGFVRGGRGVFVGGVMGWGGGVFGSCVDSTQLHTVEGGGGVGLRMEG